MNKHGQSMIEYALIAVLVILGIVVMGPYVLRSVNAHFKLWDEGVRDSFTEKLTQAPLNNIPNISTNCSCTTSAGACGSSVSQCGANQREYDHTCNPQGCDGAPASSCINDPSCCSTWVPMGCGTVPLGQAATSNNCNYGYHIEGHQCGSNTSIQCIQDSNCPLPACLGILSPGAALCQGSITSGLTQNIGITYVATCPTTSVPPCQYFCTSPYILNTTHTSCLEQYRVAPCTDSTGRNCAWCFSNCVTDINNQSFSGMCAGAPITAVSQTPQSGCGNGINDNPPGTPGAQCTVTFTY